MSDFQTVKDSVSLKGYANEKLEHVRGGLVCPACGSGRHGNQTPAFSIKGNSWHCFSCSHGGDVFDLAAIVEGLDPQDRRGQLQAVADWANVPLLSNYETTSTPTKPKPAPPKKAEQPKPDHSEQQQQEREYIARCQQRITDPAALAYLQARGFTAEEVQVFGFGYDPTPKLGWKDSSGQRHNSGRVVLPWIGSDYYHIDRATDDRAKDAKYVKPKNDDLGSQPLFNPGALEEPGSPFFVVEGVLDAYAILACGFQAVALMGTDNRDSINQISKRGSHAVAIVMLDNDDPGQAAAAGIVATLKENRVVTMTSSWQPYKDAGEWLAADRDGLRAFLTATYEQALATYQAEREKRLETVLESFRVRNPATVAADIFLGQYYEAPLPTGLHLLDNVLCGGLKTGLYTLGAVSSLGKTTLALQIADNVAAGGRPVLFVTIEQSAAELTAKSLNRALYNLTGKIVPTWQILGDNTQWTIDQRVDFEAACQVYSRDVAPNLRIMEGAKQPTVDDVKVAAEYMAELYGLAPVVFIDYLQLLAPHSDKASDKQATDHNVMALRQLARDLKTPVFVISSLNRSSYSEGVTLESFKESGAVEYGSDVLLGLQARGIEEHVEAANDKAVKRKSHKFMREHKATEERPCELVILKNRNGTVPKENLNLMFVASASLFKE